MGHPIKHFLTITKHRHAVIRHCWKAGIFWQGLCHDLSKYTPTEFIPGARYDTGTKSPNEGEREAHGYSMAWIHHKGRNRHHFEYWTDYDPVTRLVEPVKMPLRFVIEMFCDRVAASMIYQKDKYKDDSALIYYENGRNRIMIHPETDKLIHHLLQYLANNGLDKTVDYIVKEIKE